MDATADQSIADGPTDASEDLFPSNTTKVLVTDQGGLGLSPPLGSTCAQDDRTFTLLLPKRELSWKICEGSDSGLYTFVTGQRTIAEGDFAAVSGALHGLRLATTARCGNDKPSETIVFTTPAGDTTYRDDFYFCDTTNTMGYVTGLDNVLHELSNLAK